MESYVLILTIILKSNWAGAGTTSMHDFDSFDDCERAGVQWIEKIDNVDKNLKIEDSFYLCVKK